MEFALEIIGGKWKMLIIWKLGEKKMRFNELHRCIPGISHKMLTQQLRSLEKNKLIIRKIYPEIPPKVEYSLTKYGNSILPILSDMCKWSIDYSKAQDELNK